MCQWQKKKEKKLSRSELNENYEPEAINLDRRHLKFNFTRTRFTLKISEQYFSNMLRGLFETLATVFSLAL